MINLPKHAREQYSEILGARGFDVAGRDVRSDPAPKPSFDTHSDDALDVWVRDNIHAKGWDKRSRPLLVKSDLVGHGGHSVRAIHGLTQLKLWAEFFGSTLVHASAHPLKSKLVPTALRPYPSSP